MNSRCEISPQDPDTPPHRTRLRRSHASGPDGRRNKAMRPYKIHRDLPPDRRKKGSQAFVTRHGFPDEGDREGGRLRLFAATGRYHVGNTACHRASQGDLPDLHRPPDRRAVVSATGPCRFKRYQERIERSHSAAKHIGARTTHRLAHQPVWFLSSPHDIYDRHALGRQCQEAECPYRPPGAADARKCPGRPPHAKRR